MLSGRGPPTNLSQLSPKPLISLNYIGRYQAKISYLQNESACLLWKCRYTSNGLRSAAVSPVASVRASLRGPRKNEGCVLPYLYIKVRVSNTFLYTFSTLFYEKPVHKRLAVRHPKFQETRGLG